MKHFTDTYRDHIKPAHIDEYLKILRSATFALRAGSIKLDFVWSAGIPLGLRFLIECMQYFDRETAERKTTSPIRLISIDAQVREYCEYSSKSSGLANQYQSSKDLLSQLGFNLLQNTYKFMPECKSFKETCEAYITSQLTSPMASLHSRKPLALHQEVPM
jgi:hypothetical protein